MQIPKLPAVKIPKIKLPSKAQMNRALPVILGGLSVLGNALSTYFFVDTTVHATRIADAMEDKGCSKEEIRKKILPMYTVPAVTFAASNACTIGSVISSEAQIGGLLAGMAAADYRANKAKSDDDAYYESDGKRYLKRPVTLPDCSPGEVLFYDEYLETGKQDGFYACTEADWWKAYAKFQERIMDPNDICGEPAFSDFYELLPNQKEISKMLANVGSWPWWATWSICDTCSTKLVRLEEAWIDENTKYWIVNWLFPPTVSDEVIEQGFV